MRFCFNDLLYALSFGLDCVEHDLLGVATYHGPRVAAMSAAMGLRMGLAEDELLDLAGCAIMHDNALTQYIHEEKINGVDILGDSEHFNPAAHCIAGEENMKSFPFLTDVEGAILYHHENADGTGAFGRKAHETPMKAQLIHIADQLDTSVNLSEFRQDKYEYLLQLLEIGRGSLFSGECVRLFRESCTGEFLSRLQGEKSIEALRGMLPVVYREFTYDEIYGICTVIARIIDYKSEFTRKHSIGIARKAEQMGEYYGYDEETRIKLYFAGALHDVGKLVVDTDVLEKPARLTEKEYRHIQNHAYQSYKILSRIGGLGEVVDWAALHHERLDGKGYPFGKKAEELGKMERLMACLDIYQALTEERPYKKGMEHERVMGMLRDAADRGQIDGAIVEDLDSAYREGLLHNETGRTL